MRRRLATALVSIGLLTFGAAAAYAASGGLPGQGHDRSSAAQQYGERPGKGCGDRNHVHTGPPGNPSNTACPPQSQHQGTTGEQARTTRHAGSSGKACKSSRKGHRHARRGHRHGSRKGHRHGSRHHGAHAAAKHCKDAKARGKRHAKHHGHRHHRHRS